MTEEHAPNDEKLDTPAVEASYSAQALSENPGQPAPSAMSEDRMKPEFQAAQDSTKQVLTLTTAIVTITITFAKDIAKGATPADQWWLRAAWLAYAVSTLAGCWTLLAITGSMGSRKEQVGIYDSNVRRPAAVQMLAFAAAVLLTVAFGIFALPSPSR